MKSQKAGIEMVVLENGLRVPIAVPNDVVDGDGFFISFNKVDTHIYGCATTALVKGQLEAFYILNGNHMEQYLPLIEEGFDACMEYFVENIDQIAKYSERPANSPAPGR